MIFNVSDSCGTFNVLVFFCTVFTYLINIFNRKLLKVYLFMCFMYTQDNVSSLGSFSFLM